MGTTTTTNYGLIKPDSDEPQTNFPTQTAFNQDLIDTEIKDKEDRVTGLEGLGSINTYTPALEADTTNPTLGSGSVQEGFYFLLPGNLVLVYVLLRFGTSGVDPGSGTYHVTLPFGASTATDSLPGNGAIGVGTPLGSGIIRDDSNLSSSRTITPWLYTRGAPAQVRLALSTGNASIGDTAPWTWAAEDAISFMIIFEKEVS